MMSHSGGSEGLAFATAANTAKRLLLERKPFWPGIEGLMVTGDLARALNLPQPAGILVQRIGEGSICSRLGINQGTLRASIQGFDFVLGGDVILSVNNIAITAASAHFIRSGHERRKLRKDLQQHRRFEARRQPDRNGLP